MLVFRFTNNLKSSECKITKKCTQDWRLNYAHYATFIFIIISILGLVKNLYKLLFSCGQSGGGAAMMASLLLTILIGTFIVNQYCIITLINDLKKNKCPCDIKYRDFIYYMTIVHFVFCVVTYFATLNKLSKFSGRGPMSRSNNKKNNSGKSKNSNKSKKSNNSTKKRK